MSAEQHKLLGAALGASGGPAGGQGVGDLGLELVGGVAVAVGQQDLVFVPQWRDHLHLCLERVVDRLFGAFGVNRANRAGGRCGLGRKPPPVRPRTAEHRRCRFWEGKGGNRRTGGDRAVVRSRRGWGFFCCCTPMTLGRGVS